MADKKTKSAEELKREAIWRTVKTSPKYAMAKAQWLPAILECYGASHPKISYTDYKLAEMPWVTDALERLLYGDEIEKDHDEKIVFKGFSEMMDPTLDRKAGKECKYLHWVCKSFTQTPVLAEDMYKIRDRLQYFEQISKQLEKDGQPNQIKNVEGFDHLAEIMRPYEAAKMQKDAEREGRRMSKEDKTRLGNESTVLYDGPEGKIVIPHTKWASQFWGNQTKWCISAREEKDNMFKTYNVDDPIIIYLPSPEPEDLESHPNYSSFKFASVYRIIYNEWDTYDIWGEFNYPACLKKLVQAADSDYLRKHGNVHQVLGSAKIIPGALDAYSVAKTEQKLDWDFFFKCYESSWVQQGAATDRFWQKDVPQEFLSDPDFALRVIGVNPYDIRHFPENIQSNLDVCIAAGAKNKAANCNMTVRRALERIKDEPNYLLNAAFETKQGLVSIFMSVFKAEKAHVEKALAKKIIDGGYGLCPFLLPESLLTDRDYCLAAMQAAHENGTSGKMIEHLRFIPELQGNADAITSVGASIAKLEAIKKPPQARPQRSLNL